jgi:hypothetical protein
MVNKNLFQSSLICGFIQSLFLYMHKLPPFFIFIVSCGICGSVLNHGYTNSYFKFFDRAVMTIGFVINGLYINTFMYDSPDYVLTWCTMVGAVLLYLFSKFLKKMDIANLAITDVIHMMAHGLLTFLHMLLSIHLNNKCNKNHILCY